MDERNRILSIQGSFMAMGGVFFIIIGGTLADISWRDPFLVYGSAILLLPFAIKYLFEPVVSLSDQDRPEGSPLEKAPAFWVFFNYLTVFIGMILFYMIPIQIPYVLKTFGDISGLQIGIAIATSTLFGAISSWNYRNIRRKLNFTQIFLVMFCLMIVGFSIIYFAQNYSWILVAMTFCGIGWGLMMPNANLCLVTISPPAVRGRIIGGATTFVFLGQFFSPLVLQPIVKASGSEQNSFLWVLAPMIVMVLFYMFVLIRFRSRVATT